MSEIRDAIADIGQMMHGVYKANDAWGRFEEFDNALKSKGYRCVSDEEWAKHKELYINRARETAGVIPNNNIISPDADDIAEAFIRQGYSGYSEYEFIRAKSRIFSCNPKPLKDVLKKFGDAKSAPPDATPRRRVDPLILDLDGDGVETTGVNSGAYFDHDGNGFAESTGWVGADDGLLVRDVDGNGWIDSGTELLGNNTLLANEQKAANGFEALKQLDSNLDGIVDSNDAAWSSLKVWKDANGDGYHSAGEVISLEEAGVQSLNVAYTNSTQTDANGNAHQQVGSYTRTDGSTAAATDVWFQDDSMNTIAEDWLDVPEDISAMPDLRGYGNVHSLRQAMVRDGTGSLKALVKQFANTQSQSGRIALMDAILVTWTGANNVTSGSRGSRVDARQLTALEAFVGDSLGMNPGRNGATFVRSAYADIKEYFYSQLTAQTVLQPFFASAAYRWNEAAQSMRIDLSGTANKFAEAINADPVTGQTQLAEFVRVSRSLGLVPAMDTEAFYRTLEPLGLDVAGIVKDGWELTFATNGNDVLNGTTGNDVINGMGGNDTINSGAGNDTVDGGIGNDVIVDSAGNDMLDGGAGDDTITDLVGNDVISGGDGNDRIIDYAGNDLISGGNGNDYIEDLSGNDTIFGDAGNDTIIDRAGNDVLNGGAGNDRVIDYAGNDQILGGSGDDYIEDMFGNDILDGEDGNDTLIDRNGSDTIDGGAGNDVITDIGDGVNFLFGGAGNDMITFSHLADNTVDGGTGNDTIQIDSNQVNASASQNVLEGSEGNDVLRSGVGTDMYLFERGDGQDIISDVDSAIYYNSRGKIRSTSYGKIDQLALGAGIAEEDVSTTRVGNHLMLKITDPANPEADDRITIENWFSSSVYQIEQIQFADGALWTNTTIKQRAILQTGSDGDDILSGWDGADIISAGAGNDRILDAAGGNDTLQGEDGNDDITDNAGNDMIYGGAGNDVLTDWDGSDTLDGSDGDDIIIDQGSGTNLLLGGNGNDRIAFSHLANNTVQGGAGDDFIRLANNTQDAISRINTLHGGTGNDRIESGVGADTYLFNRGDGQDTISDLDQYSTYKSSKKRYYYYSAGQTDRVTFGEGISLEDITASRVGNHLILDIRNSANPEATDRLTIENWYAASNYRIEQFTFADGTTLTGGALTKLIAYLGSDADDQMSGSDPLSYFGLGGNDTISSGIADDIVDGGTGDDTIIDAAGNDTLYGGDGNDRITDTTGSDLIEGGDGDDIITDQGAGNNTLRGGAGSDTINFSYYSNNTVDGGDGNDVIRISSITNSSDATLRSNILHGGAGNDRLQSDASADTYLFSRGDGQDTINDLDQYSTYRSSKNRYYYYSAGKTDRIVFGEGITATDVSVSRLGNHIVLSITDPANPDASDSVTIENWADSRYRIEQVQFADGTTWDVATVNALVAMQMGSVGNDSLIGTDSNNILQGLAGIDVLNDITGNNLLDAGNDADTIIAGTVNDMLIGGLGNDTITTGTGYDVIVFNKGDGQDIVNASTGEDNTISLGGDFAYSDLSLTKSTNNLILKVGATDQITLKDWYLGTTNKSVVNLQVIAEAITGFNQGGADLLRDNKVENFNFANIVTAFDAEVATNAANATNWQLTDERLTAHLQAGSDTAAIGGDMAYQYGKNSNLTGMGLANAQSVIAAASFGQIAQTLNNPTVWQAEVVKLG